MFPGPDVQRSASVASAEVLQPFGTRELCSNGFLWQWCGQARDGCLPKGAQGPVAAPVALSFNSFKALCGLLSFIFSSQILWHLFWRCSAWPWAVSRAWTGSSPGSLLGSAAQGPTGPGLRVRFWGGACSPASHLGDLRGDEPLPAQHPPGVLCIIFLFILTIMMAALRPCGRRFLPHLVLQLPPVIAEGRGRSRGRVLCAPTHSLQLATGISSPPAPKRVLASHTTPVIILPSLA